jgi:DNA-binding response OmpR family regulator
MSSLCVPLPRSTMPALTKVFPYRVVGRTPSVLFIDDDANFCKCFRRRFRRAGLRFIEASTGVEGYRLAKDLMPDVVVTDLAMPFGEGEEFVAALQANSSTWSIPIIVMTGVIDEDRIMELKRYGITQVLRKPFCFYELLTAINDSLPDAGCS